MRKLNPMTNSERLAFITDKLGGIESRLISNWLITDVKATHAPECGGSTYVRVSMDNLNGVIFFDDLRDLERAVKKQVRGAWNFVVMKTSPSKPVISFCL